MFHSKNTKLISGGFRLHIPIYKQALNTCLRGTGGSRTVLRGGRYMFIVGGPPRCFGGAEYIQRERSERKAKSFKKHN